MRTFLIGAAVAILAMPAFAQSPSAGTAADTLKEVIAHGQTMSGKVQTMDVTFTTTYAADGTYKTQLVDMDRTMTGKWTIEGDKLCTVGDGNPAKDCAAYPAGKKAGDTFTVEHPRLGAASVTINKGTH